MVKISPPKPQVNVQLPFSLSITAGILTGMNRYRAGNPSFRMSINEQEGVIVTPLQGPAVVAFNADIFADWLAPDVRVTVNLSNRLSSPPTHSVLNDDYAVGQMGADHLIERGFRDFLFVGLGPTMHFSELRRAGFEGRIRERLGPAARIAPSAEINDRLGDRLAALNLPCAIMGSNDHAAVRTVEAAEQQELRVPEDLAVLGVDDDPIQCARSPVHLSSIALNSVAQGYEAMALCERLLARKRQPRELIVKLIAPLHVSTRHSTDTFAHPEPDVVRVLHVLNERASQLPGVAELARACGLSPRSLERLAREHLSRSPRELLAEHRFRFARELLVETTLSLDEIAQRAGYGNSHTLIWQCKRQTGKTPKQFRQAA